MDGHEPGQTLQEAKDGLSPRPLWLAWLLVAIGVCWCWYATWYEDVAVSGFAMTPGWLYLPMARATGELAEYIAKSRDRQAGCAVFTETERIQLESGDPASWLEGLQSYKKRWVEEHQAGGADHMDRRG